MGGPPPGKGSSLGWASGKEVPSRHTPKHELHCGPHRTHPQRGRLNSPRLTRLAKAPLFQWAALVEQHVPSSPSKHIPHPLQAMQAYLIHCRPSKHTSSTAGQASIPHPLQAKQAYLIHCRPCKHTSATAGHASIPQPLQAMQAYLIHCRPCKHTSSTAGQASIPQPLQAMQAYLSHCRPCKHTSAIAGQASIPQPLQAMQACCTVSLPIRTHPEPCDPSCETCCIDKYMTLPSIIPTACGLVQQLQQHRQDSLHLPFKD